MICKDSHVLNIKVAQNKISRKETNKNEARKLCSRKKKGKKDKTVDEHVGFKNFSIQLH